MIYRPLGNTGMSASVIGLGAEHLDNAPYEQVKETVDAALGYDFNIMDVFMPGAQVRENIAKALGSRRKDMIIQGHIGSSDINQQYDIARDMPTVKKYFENFLIYFDYADIGMLFFIDSDEDYRNVFETPFIDYALKLKEQGKIRAIGASSHNPLTAKRVVDTGLVEVLMFSVNMAFDMMPSDMYALDALENGFHPESLAGVDPARAELYRLCESKGVAITVMKTYCAGKLLSAEHTPFGKAMTPGQCIHYALTRPAAVSALVGCKSRAEVAEAARYLELSDKERDYGEIAQSLKGTIKGACVYCNHCQPCPAGLDIAAITKYLDIARLDSANIPPSIAMHYGALEHGAAECTACGSCEARCPFDVEIIANMNEAQIIFGK